VAGVRRLIAASDLAEALDDLAVALAPPDSAL